MYGLKYAQGTIWFSHDDRYGDSDNPYQSKTRVFHGDHPVLVISNNDRNATHPTVLVAPISSTENTHNERILKLEQPEASDSYKEVYILISSTYEVDKSCLLNYRSSIDTEMMIAVKKSLADEFRITNEDLKVTIQIFYLYKERYIMVK